jgi:hypothetical protein
VRRHGGWGSPRDNEVDGEGHQLRSQYRVALVETLCESGFDPDVASLREAARAPRFLAGVLDHCGCHAALSRSIALRVVIIFRMTATMMILDFLLAWARVI